MFEVCVEETFAAGHALRGYKGKCENVHGHNYRIQVHVEGRDLNAIGLLTDFGDVKKALRAVIARLDHQFINDLDPFTVVNPSAENMAKYFYDEIRAGLDQTVSLARVTVWETDTACAVYRP